MLPASPTPSSRQRKRPGCSGEGLEPRLGYGWPRHRARLWGHCRRLEGSTRTLQHGRVGGGRGGTRPVRQQRGQPQRADGRSVLAVAIGMTAPAKSHGFSGPLSRAVSWGSLLEGTWGIWAGRQVLPGGWQHCWDSVVGRVASLRCRPAWSCQAAREHPPGSWPSTAALLPYQLGARSVPFVTSPPTACLYQGGALQVTTSPPRRRQQ